MFIAVDYIALVQTSFGQRELLDGPGRISRRFVATDRQFLYLM